MDTKEKIEALPQINLNDSKEKFQELLGIINRVFGSTEDQNKRA